MILKKELRNLEGKVIVGDAWRRARGNLGIVQRVENYDLSHQDYWGLINLIENNLWIGEERKGGKC